MTCTSFAIRRSSEMNEQREKVMAELWNSKIFCDFNIKAEDEEIKCHRMVLVASSNYFKNVFIKSGEEQMSATEMVMDGYSAAIVKLMVDYLYDNEIRITDAFQALAVLDLATLWQLDDQFMKQVEQFLVGTALKVNNCLEVRDQLLRQDKRHMVALTDQFISDHFAEVTLSDNFQQASLPYVLSLFDSDELRVEDEKVVYESALRWVNADRSSRQKHIYDIVKTVRLGLMEPEDVASISLDLACANNNKELNEFLKVNINYLKNKKYGYQEKVKIKSMTKRQGQVVKKTIMCLGGFSGGDDILKSIEISEDDGKTWTAGPEMMVKRSCFSATVCSGYVYVVGGYASVTDITKSCERYNIKSKQWDRIIDLPAPRCRHSAGCVGQQLFVTGGDVIGDDDDDAEPTDTVLALDVGDIGRQWLAAPSMIQSRTNHVSCSLNGVLYAIGGWCDAEGNMKSCEMFEPMKSTWKSIAPTNFFHQSAGACTAGAYYIYVAGHYGTPGPRFVEVYNVTTDQWSVLQAPLTACTDSLTLTYYCNSVYAIGGEAYTMDDTEKDEDDQVNCPSDVQILSTQTNMYVLVRIKVDSHWPRHQYVYVLMRLSKTPGSSH